MEAVTRVRWLATSTETAELRAHLPARIRCVAHQKGGHVVSFLPRYLREFAEEVELEELPGWTVLTR